MQLSKKTQRQASIAAVSGLVIIGAASLFFKTYPHLNPFSCQTKKADKPESSGQGEKEAGKEGTTTTTEESAVLVDYDKLSKDELEAVLTEKNVDVPADASLEDLAKLAKSI
ncbi:hypothetical protein PICMEDRAFT_71898 [Pichia membranifaciens NRRL Y-2026]|uniref:Uncharacterized protein n=1 Tax=Pichia membranifaciens NRRL Y-2026 TaxID=763406 RepID=A0A1E3NP62_9ASCO|nr:hypothetical protein PICMEDRAFT_71898 [Pichia membranifaciens NRRL Y-2026]ODQ47881.1 hypothetical protein PICMEDRAFT_71898 [Pichia membranifaciens NRRL Y-2026]